MSKQYKYHNLPLILSISLIMVVAMVGCGTTGSSSSSSPSASPDSSTHSVSLSWNPSTSVVIGYNIYRATQSGGPYTLVDTSLQPAYSDNHVQSGSTYFYVVTAVNGSSQESPFSNESKAAIPTP